MYDSSQPLYRKPEYFLRSNEKSFYLKEKNEIQRKDRLERRNTPFRIRNKIQPTKNMNESDSKVKYSREDTHIIREMMQQSKDLEKYNDINKLYDKRGGGEMVSKLLSKFKKGRKALFIPVNSPNSRIDI